MSLRLRHVSEDDVPLLAALNRHLVEDGLSANPLSDEGLEARMRHWLTTDHRAVIFERDGETTAYGVYRSVPGGIYLQQFFVARPFRRQGVGREAIALFRRGVLGEKDTLFLDVNPLNERGLVFWSAIGFTKIAVSFRLPPAADSSQRAE